MTEHDGKTAWDSLDQATEALRDTPIPDGPTQHLVASTIEALRPSVPDTVRLHDRRQLMFRIARYSGATAAASLLCCFAVWFFVMDRGAGVAFAGVLENIRKAKTVTFRNTQKLGRQSENKMKYYIQEDRLRIEMEAYLIYIIDLKQKKALQLLPPSKIAKHIDLRKRAPAASFKNPIAQLRKLKSEDAEKTGDEEVGGRLCQVYRVRQAEFLGLKGEMTLWVDPKTELPVKIHFERPDGKMKLTFDKFTWDKAIDEDLFKLEVPDGYTVQKE